jgi:hypothetical protein
MALRYSHVQFNDPKRVKWLVFDIDRPGAFFAAYDANLPAPNFIAENPKNGHAHFGYLLAKRVHKFSASRQKPLHYLAAVELGLRRRLGADRGYAGVLCKNPLHPKWRVHWLCDKPYLLDELNDALFPRDKLREPTRQTSGLGRNCDLFDKTRHLVYPEVRRFKRSCGSEAEWRERCIQVAAEHNQFFDTPLGPREVRSIGKSVTKWTWRNFSEAGFSKRQAFCGRRGMAKRWAGHVPVAQKAKEAGMTLRTWQRRMALQLQRGAITLSDNSPVKPGATAQRKPGRAVGGRRFACASPRISNTSPHENHWERRT